MIVSKRKFLSELKAFVNVGLILIDRFSFIVYEIMETAVSCSGVLNTKDHTPGGFLYGEKKTDDMKTHDVEVDFVADVLKDLIIHMSKDLTINKLSDEEIIELINDFISENVKEHVDTLVNNVREYYKSLTDKVYVKFIYRDIEIIE